MSEVDYAKGTIAMEKGPKGSPLFAAMFSKNGKAAREVSFDGIPHAVMARLVIAVVDTGCAVLFGTTRDRGAWALTFFGESIPKGRQTDYCGEPDEVVDWITDWTTQWEAAAESLKDSKATKRR
jgi:hypothetical protein